MLTIVAAKRAQKTASAQLDLLAKPLRPAATPTAKPETPVAPPAAPPAPRPVKLARRATAESMATRQRDISVSEFFTKNRHLLGFDSPAKALLTTVKEAVDNSLDACEEAGILPEIHVEIVELAENRHRVVIQDNGPGIVKAQAPKVFGKLLYGSKFHRLRQSRGQQGIGISAAAMYGQLTTGKPVVITSKTRPGQPAHHFEIVIDTAKNAPVIVKDEALEWAPDHGTRVEIELESTYKGGRRSADEFLELVAIANPHATIGYQPPKDRPAVRYERVTDELPREPEEIKPHPYGVELGALAQILKESSSRTLRGALCEEFCRVTPKVADELCALAKVKPAAKPKALAPQEIERLHKAIPQVRIFTPPASCVVPIGEDLLRKGLEREIRADFYATCTRPPSVYRGNPFAVEAGLAFGGELRAATDEDEPDAGPAEGEAPIRLMRFTNRAPLQYQPGACAIFRGVVETNWRQYGLSQPRGALPLGPMVLIVHIASVWVPFTSESKEAVAHYDEIVKEIKLALREVGRRLHAFLRHRAHDAHEAKRRSIFELYIPEVSSALESLTKVERAKTAALLQKLAGRYTGAEEATEA
ncbi:MAG: DNA topoisomerase VI subunit B [Myxococcota bacterium]